MSIYGVIKVNVATFSKYIWHINGMSTMVSDNQRLGMFGLPEDSLSGSKH